MTQDQIPGWLRAVKGVPLPGLQPATLAKGQILMPPGVKLTGVAYPDIALTGGIQRMYLITAETPTGMPYPRWTRTIGHIRLNNVAPRYLSTSDGMVFSAPGFQLLGPEVSEHYIDWSVSEESANTAFYYYTPQLHALMLELALLVNRVMQRQPGEVVEEVWEYADLADYYELKLLFMYANFARYRVSVPRYVALEALERWWYRLHHQFEGIQSVVGLQVREAFERHIAAIQQLVDAKPSF